MCITKFPNKEVRFLIDDNNMIVQFINRNIEKYKYKYSVIVARSDEKWVLCKHKERDTLEFPGGHIEDGETPLQAAKRELFEETGAVVYTIKEATAYRVQKGEYVDYGMLYYANVSKFAKLPNSEMEEVFLLNDLSTVQWTYPHIQPLMKEYIMQEGLL